MSKSTILFKASAVSVLRQPEQQDGVAIAGKAILIAGKRSVILDAEATELLVGYLKVIRAYFFSFQHSRKIIAGLFEKVAQLLTETQSGTGNQVITNRHVSDIIQRLGCLDDWQKQYPYPGNN